ncbi:MAG: hypothetical protein ACOYI5_05950, partial [Christensenellales bacterium]
ENSITRWKFKAVVKYGDRRFFEISLGIMEGRIITRHPPLLPLFGTCREASSRRIRVIRAKQTGHPGKLNNQVEIQGGRQVWRPSFF